MQYFQRLKKFQRKLKICWVINKKAFLLKNYCLHVHFLDDLFASFTSKKANTINAMTAVLINV